MGTGQAEFCNIKKCIAELFELTCQVVLKAARVVLQDLPSTLVGSLVAVEHLGSVGRRTLVRQDGGEGTGEMAGKDRGEMAAGEGGPGWECTL